MIGIFSRPAAAARHPAPLIYSGMPPRELTHYLLKHIANIFHEFFPYANRAENAAANDIYSQTD